MKKWFFFPDWFKTGDTCAYEESAHSRYFKIVGRSSVDVIKSGGYKIGALEIEAILLTNSNIKEVVL